MIQISVIPSWSRDQTRFQKTLPASAASTHLHFKVRHPESHGSIQPGSRRTPLWRKRVLKKSVIPSWSKDLQLFLPLKAPRTLPCFLVLALGLSLATRLAPADDLPQNTLFYTSVSGIGAGFASSHGHIVVKQLVPDSPAAKSGLHPGDILQSVDGQSVASMKVVDVVNRIRGPEGTIVKIEVDRDGRRLTFSITRALLRFRRPNSEERR